jgi:hypothetical protein
MMRSCRINPIVAEPLRGGDRLYRGNVPVPVPVAAADTHQTCHPETFYTVWK